MREVSIKDVATKSGYGVGTVSRVLSGDKSVKDSTREKILKTIDELHYVRNVNGARLRTKHSGVIAIMVPIINHPFFAEFVEALEEEANQAGCSLLLITSQMNKEKEGEILLKIKQHEIDGAIFVTHYEHDEKELEGCPLVSIDRHLPGNVPLVTSDNYGSTMKALETFYAHGARRIGFVGTKPTVESEVSQRKKAYDDFIAEKNLPDLSKWEDVSHGQETKLVEAFPKEHPDLDAVFASNIMVAATVYALSIQNGKRFPEDLELISYDGTSQIWSGNPIDCVRQDIRLMAKIAFSTLQDLIEERECQPINIIPTTLILGKTSKAK